MIRRTLSLLLVFAMLLSFVAIGATGCASKDSTDTSGEGTTGAETTEMTVYQQALKDSFAALGEIPKASKPYKIGHVFITLENPFWQTLKDGSEAAGKEYGVEVIGQAVASEDDVTGQLNVLETMLGQDYDAIIVHTITAENLVPGILTGLGKKIVIVDADGRVDTTEIKAKGLVLPQLNMIDFVKQGELGGQYIAERVDKGSKVAIIEGISGAPQSDARAQGAKQAFEAAGLEVVASQPGNWDSTVSLNVAQNILQANPDLKGFYCANDVMALAAAQAVEEAGKTGEVLIVGTDFIAEGKTAIEEGRMAASVAFSPDIVGRLAVAATLKLLEGETVPDDLKVLNVVIDKDNVDMMEDWK